MLRGRRDACAALDGLLQRIRVGESAVRSRGCITCARRNLERVDQSYAAMATGEFVTT